jgi:hypothetical protein
MSKHSFAGAALALSPRFVLFDRLMLILPAAGEEP